MTFMIHVCVLQRCRNLLDMGRPWIFIITYLLCNNLQEYTECLHIIDVCIYDELDYIVYPIIPISHYEFVIIDN